MTMPACSPLRFTPDRRHPLHRWVLGALVAPALVLVAGCGGRPSAGYFDEYQQALRAGGNLRTETAPEDAPYGVEDLVRNFERIALHREVEFTRPGSEDNWETGPLERWEGPLRYEMFGGAITGEDRRQVKALMDRVARLTGLEIYETGVEANFLITITRPGERTDLSHELAQSNTDVAETFDLWRSTSAVICYGTVWYELEAPGEIIAAMVVIGSETRGLMRESCIHEEIIQALGLANDHPDVRPSIFNDDEEFALMTEHDEDLLRILYDPRLKPGMNAAEAMPVVRTIAGEIQLGGARVTGSKVAVE